MSRDLRKVSKPTPTPRKVRRGSDNTDISSSSDDYAALDLISDSDEEEPDVIEAEEQNIMESEEDKDDAPWPNTNNGWHGSTELKSKSFPEHMSRILSDDSDTEPAVRTSPQPTTTRRVRFHLESESEDLDTDSSDYFPDVFLDQSSLDPTFRYSIENGDDNDDLLNSDDGWDLHSDQDVQNLLGDAGQPDTTELSDTVEQPDDVDEYSGPEESAGSDGSGYSSDFYDSDGETTDEEDPPFPKTIQKPASVLHPPENSSESEEEIPVDHRARGPKLASWVHDDTKPFAVLDNNGKKLIMFRPTKTRRLRPGFQADLARLQQQMDDMVARSMPSVISNSGDIMLSGMYNQLELFPGQAIGPPEAFQPFTSISADGTIFQDTHSSSFDDEDDLDDEDLWNVEDFLNFGEPSSESEGEEEASPSSDTIEPSSTPARPTTATSEDQVHPLLNHLDGKNVGAFRLNQNFHKARNNASKESLAFSGPFGQGTLRGIKGGRLAAANTPITPMRKQKTLRAIPSSPGSPLANMAAGSSKRKFDGEHRGHKRSRSAI